MSIKLGSHFLYSKWCNLSYLWFYFLPAPKPWRLSVCCWTGVLQLLYLKPYCVLKASSSTVCQSSWLCRILLVCWFVGHYAVLGAACGKKSSQLLPGVGLVATSNGKTVKVCVWHNYSGVMRQIWGRLWEGQCCAVPRWLCRATTVSLPCDTPSFSLMHGARRVELKHLPWSTFLVLSFAGRQTIPAHAGHAAEFTVLQSGYQTC